MKTTVQRRDLKNTFLTTRLAHYYAKFFSHAISVAILDRQDRMAFSLNSEAVYLITLR